MASVFLVGFALFIVKGFLIPAYFIPWLSSNSSLCCNVVLTCQCRLWPRYLPSVRLNMSSAQRQVGNLFTRSCTASDLRKQCILVLQLKGILIVPHVRFLRKMHTLTSVWGEVSVNCPDLRDVGHSLQLEIACLRGLLRRL